MGQLRPHIFKSGIFSTTSSGGIAVSLSKAIFCTALLSLLSCPIFASERFGTNDKEISFGLFSGSGVITGEKNGLGNKEFSGPLPSDQLYLKPRSLTFEYAEHVGKVSLASGISYSSVEVTDELRSELGLGPDATLKMRYLDIPFMYRINAYSPGKSQWNLNAGFSLAVMVDFIVSSDAIFSSESSSGTTGSSESNKHTDFGFGFGGGFGVERRISSSIYLAAQAGFQRPFTGVTRASAGYIRLGVRLFER